jgi:hypothetical protein
VPAPTIIWARIGGGFERLDNGARHGPADPAVPPPGDGLQPLLHDGTLAGWTNAKPTPALAQLAFEEGRRLASERRSHLLGRLGHKLRSAVLSLQESSRQAAFGRPELLEALYGQAQEVGRRAAALEAAALDPKDLARFVVVGAMLNTAAPEARIDVPGDAVVRAPEPVLFEALLRTYEWMGGPGMHLGGERSGDWWKITADPAPARQPLAAPELGEPLIRLLVDIHCGGWLDVQSDRAVMWLPAT